MIFSIDRTSNNQIESEKYTTEKRTTRTCDENIEKNRINLKIWLRCVFDQCEKNVCCFIHTRISSARSHYDMSLYTSLHELIVDVFVIHMTTVLHQINELTNKIYSACMKHYNFLTSKIKNEQIHKIASITANAQIVNMPYMYSNVTLFQLNSF